MTDAVIPEEIARILQQAMDAIDQLWVRQRSLPSCPGFVFLAAQIIDHTITKCLHMGGWHLYINPDTERRDIQRVS